MKKLNRYNIPFFLSIFIILISSLAEASPFIAYSLSEAETKLRAFGQINTQVMEIGGITNPIAMVYDESSNDLIFIGRAVPGERKITLDDLVTALRSKFVYGTCPKVSIDKTPETQKTLKQTIRFDGGVAETQFGNDLLEADILLKKMGLGEVSADIWGVRSYSDMSATDWEETGKEDNIDSRFWFIPDDRESNVAGRQGVVVVKKLKIKVETEVMSIDKNGQRISDPMGVQFASALTNSYSDISVQFPQLQRLNVLFKMAGIAEGIYNLSERESTFKPKIDYWIQEYRVLRVETPKEHPLLIAKKLLQKGDKTSTQTIDGGVKLKSLMSDLADGVATALRDIVLISKPKGNPLIWRVPLEGWELPDASETTTEKDSDSREYSYPSAENIGTSLGRRINPVGQTDSTPNISMNYTAPSSYKKEAFNFTDRFSPQKQSSNVGGVMLQDVAKVSGGDHAKVDLASGNFSLIVDGQNARLAPEAYRKFITALWAVYYSNEDPGISIDPVGCFYFDPDDPERDKKLEECLKRYEKKEEKHMVRYIGKVINTDLGRVMREADYVMKKWSVGTEKPGITGFKSPDEYRGWKTTDSEGSSRFWFVPEAMKFKRGGDMLLFEDGRMTVKTEYMFKNDEGAQSDPYNEKFARFFTERYGQIAEKYPVYQELFEYAKMVSLAKYLKEQGIPMFWFLMANKDLVITEDSPGTVDALAKGSEYYKNLYIMGGVDLGFDVKQEGHYVYDEQAVSAINDAVSKLPSMIHSTSLSSGKDIAKTVSESFSFDLGKNTYTVVPQHSLTSGKDKRGNRYQTDIALRGAGFQLSEDSLNEFKAKIFRWELANDANPLLQNLQECSSAEKLNAPEEERCKRLEAELKVKIEKAEKRTEIISDKLKSLKGKDFKDENRFSRALDEALEKEDIQFKNIIMKLAYYKTNLELVRYFKPGQQETGEFGKGWRLLIPYRVKTVDDTVTEFQGYTIKKKMAVENLLTGEQEVLVFNADRYSVAGYVPAKLESSQVVGLFLMSDASYRLADKLGNEFGFDKAGYLTDMIFSEENHIHIEYLDKFTSAFEKTPYQIQPADGEQLEFLNVSIPKRMAVKNLINGDSEALIFSDKGELAGYVPEDAEKSRYKILALMSDASFRLLDKKENETVFGPSWSFDGKFKEMAFPNETRMVSSVSQGNQKISFKYTMDKSGDVMIAGAYLSQGQEMNPVYAVTYHYDDEGRLFSVKGEDSKVAELHEQLRNEVITANK